MFRDIGNFIRKTLLVSMQYLRVGVREKVSPEQITQLKISGFYFLVGVRPVSRRTPVALLVLPWQRNVN